jgi:hypothetical protein
MYRFVMMVYQYNYHNSRHYSLSCLLFKIQRSGDWILFSSSAGITQLDSIDGATRIGSNCVGSTGDRDTGAGFLIGRFSTLKMEGIRSSETSVHIRTRIWQHLNSREDYKISTIEKRD